MQLLNVLVALGGTAVPIDRITEALWPDAGGALAVDAFHTTLRRLRSRFHPGLVHVGDGRASINPDKYAVDALKFEAAILECNRAIQGGKIAEALQCSNQVFKIDTAPFLEGEFEPIPVPAARARLHSLFLRHVERMGRVLSECGRPSDSLDAYGEALAIDPGAEDIAQAFLAACLGQSRPSEGLRAYETLQEALHSQYGVEPSQPTRALRQALAEAGQTPRREPAGELLTPPDPPPVARAATVPDRKPVTVHVSQFEGLGNLDLERIEEVMSAFKLKISEQAGRNGGVPTRFGADGMAMVFGAAPSREDDPVRALQAGLEARDQAEKEGKLRLRSGAATGLALVSPGGPEEGSVHASGAVAGLAADLCAKAAPGELLACAETKRRVKEWFRLAPHPRQGLDSPAEPAAWNVMGSLPLRSRFDASMARGLTLFVGRESEIEVLNRCLRRAGKGEGQLVTVSGEAGIGKNRLLHELPGSVDRKHMDLFEGRCPSYGAEAVYHLFFDVLRQSFGLNSPVSPRDLERTAIANILAAGAGLSRFLPRLLHLLLIPSEAHRLPQGAPGRGPARSVARGYRRRADRIGSAPAPDSRIRGLAMGRRSVARGPALSRGPNPPLSAVDPDQPPARRISAGLGTAAALDGDRPSATGRGRYGTNARLPAEGQQAPTGAD